MAGIASTAEHFAQTPGRAAVYRYVADLVVLAIAGGCVMEASAQLLSVYNPVVLALMVIAWTAAAAKRLVAWRHGTRGAISIRGASQTITIVAGMAPWFLLPLVRQPLQDSTLWAPLAFPLFLRVVGACLMMSGVFAPFWVALRGSGPSTGDTGFALSAIGFFLLSSSPLVGVLTTGWLVLRLSVDRGRRHLPSPLVTGPIGAAHLQGAAA